jgi:DNA-binding SARP family transcriptional activator/basic membrane lipoprotein Med (substrate-binding protein (PBP1-ABC) superfamily)
VVDYRVLGPLEVAQDGRSADLGPPKQRALLAILLLHANEIVPVDRLIDLLWPDLPPRHAAHAIQVYVSELRRVLEPLAGEHVIEWRAPGYVLRVDPETLDANLAERLVKEAAHEIEIGDLAAADSTLGRARELWRGPPLADFVYEEFAQDDIRHLTDVWLEGTETLAEVKLGLGDTTEVLTLAEAAIRQDPLRERAHEFRMLALYRAGRAAEALRSYESYRRALAEELAVEPSPRLRRLHEAILIHDPGLGPAGDDRPAATPLVARNPYKGLRAFGTEDAGDFFGREALVRRVLDVLAGGARLVTLVGPSGSGKSSVLGAGLIPALEADAVPGSAGWAIARLRPGARPTEALRAALAPTAEREGLLVIDQLEEAFDRPDDPGADRFLARLTRAVAGNGSRVRAVLALRADYYDRPLLHAAFAEAILPGVVHVLPMTADELEAAIVEPARKVGVAIDPALLAELVSETVDRPGALPLLELTLAELFDRRAADVLDLEGYRALGGLRGALSRRAEEAFARLDGEGQQAARQILLRLVGAGGGRHAVARRASVAELAALGIDPLALSDVLRLFEASRLLTFDRDPVSGASTVEVAHEALLSEWGRLAGWIEQARTDLRLHDALAARVEEWAAEGRRPEDLLAGRRLDDYEAWARESTLRLTADEQAFIDASLERRRGEEADAEERASRERRLERRARVRLVGFVAAAALFVAAVAYAIVSWPGRAPDIALVYPGPGDGGMYDAVGVGFDEAAARLGVDAQTIIEQPDRLQERLRRLSEQGVRLIVVAFDMSNPDVEIVARDHSRTAFIASDYWGELPNVATPRFAVEEGSFLVGAAAALTSRTGAVAVIGTVDTNTEWWFSAGFEAGALTVDHDVIVRMSYLASSPATYVAVKRAALEAYRDGADVVFFTGRSYASNRAPLGVFEAAFTESAATGRQLWAIGVDANWYVALPLVPGAAREATGWRKHVLTSLVTRYDLGYARMTEDFARDALPAGERRFALTDGAFEIPSSGGFLDHAQTTLDSLRERIVAGQIEVPRYPSDRLPPGAGR